MFANTHGDDGGGGDRERALAFLDTFCTRVLPGTIRRLVAWKGLPHHLQVELRAELRQELALDTLEHAAEVLSLAPPARHARWMRVAERYVYRHYVAVPLLQEVEPPAAVPAEPEDRTVGLDLGAATMQNGRLNVFRTAARRGVGERYLRRHLDVVAERLGAGEVHRRFWRARLAEALTGLAADLLREHCAAALLLVARRRAGPDPARRLHRLRRLAAQFHIRPGTLRERSVLRAVLRRRTFGPESAIELLGLAVELAPDDAAAWSWLFEAALVHGDVVLAARALRRARAGSRARSAGAAPALARARLREARGDPRGAAAIVRRAAARRPRDPTLAAVLAALERSIPLAEPTRDARPPCQQ
jgi:hypothetical protein